MPPASGAGERSPQLSTQADPVLAAEREHLCNSREYLRLMREDVLGLRAMGGDRVSEEYLKADLHHRAEALREIPGTPLFFGRLDYAGDGVAPDESFLAETDGHARAAAAGDGGGGRAGRAGQAGQAGRGRALPGERFHIGRRHIHDGEGHPVVIDWRAPVSRPFYRASAADPMGLARRRRFGFAGAELTAYEDEEFTPPRQQDRAGRGGRPGGPGGPGGRGGAPVSAIMLAEIERPRSGPMRDIVATIQPDQDDIVRAEAGQTVCVQGAPGTGKTAVGLHRVAYLLYAHPEPDAARRRAGDRAEPGIPVLHPRCPAGARRSRCHPADHPRPGRHGAGAGH